MPRRRVALLAGGDAAALLMFAAVGRGSHAELDGIAGVLDTAWPFLLGASGYGVIASGLRKGLIRELHVHSILGGKRT